MKNWNEKHHLDGLAALLLFAVFAVCILLVLLTGADTYRRLTRRDRAAYDRRTGVQYIAAQVRQADVQDGMAVEDLDGVQALVLGKGQGYATWIYCYEGYLMELYTMVDSGLGPEDGEKIMEMAGLGFSLDKSVLTAYVTDAQGQEDTLQFALQSGRECGP